MKARPYEPTHEPEARADRPLGYVAPPLVNHAGQENADCLPEAEFIPAAELDAHLEQARAIKDAQAEITQADFDAPYPDPEPAGIGTFACPICGVSSAHAHTADEVRQYRAGQGPYPADEAPGPRAQAQVLPKMRLKDPIDPGPMPKLGEVEVFMNEDVEHALKIFMNDMTDATDPASRLSAMRHVMMFALQVAAVNLGVKPDSMITERPIGRPPAPTDKRAKVKAARKQNNNRRRW